MEDKYKGSRKQMLEWTGKDDFLESFESKCLSKVDAVFDFSKAEFTPTGKNDPVEATSRNLKNNPAKWQLAPQWGIVLDWWLEKEAQTPNWDCVIECQINNKRGVILVEAKSHVAEMNPKDKTGSGGVNRDSIVNATAEASKGWECYLPNVNLSHKHHYQLSNRLAHTWKLASLGIPVVLVYLGFLNDDSHTENVELLRDESHFLAAVRDYAKGIGAEDVFNNQYDFGEGRAWVVTAVV